MFCCLGFADTQILPQYDLLCGVPVVEMAWLVWLLTACWVFSWVLLLFYLQNNYFPSTTESLSPCLFFTFLLSYSSSYSSEKLKVFSACHIMHLKSFIYLYCDFLLSVLPHKIFLCIHLECSSPFPHFIFFLCILGHRFFFCQLY